MNKPFVIGFVSSYIPRQCGIATFTNDLARGINKISTNGGYKTTFTAVNDIPDGYNYDSTVKFDINIQNINDFKEAAHYLNLSDCDVVNLQHEFGLYGGEAGSNILYLLDKLNKPIITTLHTILDKPDEMQYKVMKEIGNRSSHLVVLSHRSYKILQEVYDFHSGKVKYIPHGAPDVPFIDPVYYKDKFNLTGKKVLLTFGLLGPNKGVEDVISAMPDVVNKYPEFVFIVLGATHPNVKRESGESYRYSLMDQVKKNHLEDHVRFVNRFVDKSELLEYLLMSDMYISPYQNKEQIVSGTLTYALASGKTVISTPYWYAEEALDNGRGVIVPFKNPEVISETIQLLLGDENKRNEYRKKAYDYGRKMIWQEVGESYVDLFHKAVSEYKMTHSSPAAIYRYKSFSSLPEISLVHLKNLTDTTGIIQHATYSIPDRNEGYCVDDNVRALLVAVMYKLSYNDSSLDTQINTYLSFLHHSLNHEKGLFRNFMTYNRVWLDETGSEDSNGRVIYALGYLLKNLKEYSNLSLVKNLFDQNIKNMTGFKNPRSMAQIIIGCIFYLNRFSGAREIKEIVKNLADVLLELYYSNSSEDWQWFEDTVTYENARLPQALLMYGLYTDSEKHIEAGLKSLDWYYNCMYDEDKKCISLIGNEGWYPQGGVKAKYDQQPLEIPAIIDACFQAYLATRDPDWITKLNIAFSWFLGNNDRQEIICNLETGGCSDGLNSTKINLNQGAESTICWLLSLLRMRNIKQYLQTEYNEKLEKKRSPLFSSVVTG